MKKRDTHTFLGGASIYLISNIGVAAIPFLLLPVLTRVLGPHEYGRVAMFQALVSGLAGLVGLSVAGAANRKFFDTGIDTRTLGEFIGSCLQIVAGASVVILIFLYAFQESLVAWLDLEPDWLYLAVLMCAASVVLQLRLGQWQVRREAAKYGLLQVFQALLNMLLSLLFVVVLLLGAEGRIAGQVVAACIGAAIGVALLRKDSLIYAWTWRPEHIREALKFGVPLIPHVAGLYLLSFADRLVINDKLGVAQAGVYVVAAQLTGALGIVFDAVNKAYVPWLFAKLQDATPAETRMVVLSTYSWFGLILSAVLVAFLIGPRLVLWLAGPGYEAAGDVIGWLALGAGFSGMYLMVTNYIFYSKKTGLLSVVTLASAGLNVFLLILLTERLGLSGAAIAFAVASGVRFLLTWWVAQRSHPMPWFDLSRTSNR